MLVILKGTENKKAGMIRPLYRSMLKPHLCETGVPIAKKAIAELQKVQ